MSTSLLSDPLVPSSPCTCPRPPPPPPGHPPEEEHERDPQPEHVMPGRRRDHDQRNQDRSQRREAPAPRPKPPGRALLLLLVPAGQVPDKLAELAQRLCLVAAIESLLELGHVETPLGVALAKTLRDPFAVGISGAEIGVATRDAIPEVLVGHVSLLSDRA